MVIIVVVNYNSYTSNVEEKKKNAQTFFVGKFGANKIVHNIPKKL